MMADHRQIACVPSRPARGFTLVEMVVVIGIIILLTGLVVPAATQLWRDRKIADAQNLITGMLMTARARAIQSGGVETGLFFFVDDQGVQHVAPITQNPNDAAESDASKLIRGWESDVRWSNVFTVLRDRTFTMPAPMRVTPLYTFCPDTQGKGMCAVNEFGYSRFSDNELKNNTIEPLTVTPGTTDTAQVHRNFFTLVFTPNGEMIVGRDVVIRDVDDEAVSEPDAKDGNGAVTGLKVYAPDDGIKDYYNYDDPPPTPAKINFVPSGAMSGNLSANYPPKWIIADSSPTAINFPSVDGLLVYDDSLFNEAGDAEPEVRREYLKNYGMPFYINRITGAVVRGPVGETVAATP